MKRIAIWFAATATLVILLLGYHTSTNRDASGSTPSGIGAPSTGGSQAPGGATSTPVKPRHHRRSSAGGSPDPKASPKAPASKSYTGQTIQTARGPVEVRIVVRSGKIVAVAVPIHPNSDPRSMQINHFALPRLVQETRSAQSARIDMVSGATITSNGYEQSLQSALDKAGIR